MEKKVSIRNSSQMTRRIVFLAVIIVLVTFAFWGPSYAISVLTLIMLYLSLGQMWNLLSGYTGLTSLGQQAFVGIGGYVLAVVCQKYDLPIILSFVIGAVVSILFALLISMPIFKMNGVYFTIGTWIIAEALYIFFVNWGFVNYGIGYNISASYVIPPWGIYLLSVVLGIGSIVVVSCILHSKMGLALMAIRDNTSAAEVRGIQIYRTKLIVFLISSFWVTMTGIVIYLNQAYIIPSNAFSIDWTIAMVFIVIIGGSATIEGPIIGSIVYIVLKQYLYNFPGLSNIFLGIIAIVIILIAPGGIMGFINDRLNLDLFGIRRKMKC